MEIRQVKVELVGLFPTIYQTCARCYTPGFLGARAIDAAAEQLKEYPPEVRQAQEQLAELYFNLLRDFGERVVPISVGALSWRGVWLTLRHRLGRDVAVVIDGRTAVPANQGYPAVRSAVAAALQA